MVQLRIISVPLQLVLLHSLISSLNIWDMISAFPSAAEETTNLLCASKGNKTKARHKFNSSCRGGQTHLVTFRLWIYCKWTVSAVKVMQPLESSWPLGAVTSQALHTFHSAGTDSSYWTWGTETNIGPDSLLPEEGNHQWRDFIERHWPQRIMNANLKLSSSSSDPQQWKSSAVCRVSTPVRQISGLKSYTWAIHYPPTNPPSSLAPPKLHINFRKVTHFTAISLCCPTVPMVPINPRTVHGNSGIKTTVKLYG